MTVLLLGGTGRTGKLILSELLARGHAVKVIVRNKNKISINSPVLAVFEGSTLDETLMRSAMNGCDAVISALNISRYSDFPWSRLRTPELLMSATIKNVIAIAKEMKLKRVIVLSAWGVNETMADIPWWFRWTIRYSNIKYGYLDHGRQEDLLAASDLDWTAVRPVGLINSKAKKEIKVILNRKDKPSIIISRLDVARFAVKILEENTFLRLAPAISW
ncbi:NAD-dependent epimerase/dehydratase family protein [Mucilaginibacter terrenus]|uniref:NAD-dependent epimerase/dehydratase family protein n=1 Tax=Mucilaginibacter terrenus TaxID=2482727 RepID=A0A3E2NTI4_9SPHI|nr:NAD(P)H-binding protein [Mucilaginibacter terrenus]RFZ84231.1 NAD-dependent epimerase/dehydratase family protein [Mucilaginibacter terrenus]